MKITNCPICQSELIPVFWESFPNDPSISHFRCKMIDYNHHHMMTHHYKQMLSNYDNILINELIYINQYKIFQVYTLGQTLIYRSRPWIQSSQPVGKFSLIPTEKLLYVNIANILTLQ